MNIEEELKEAMSAHVANVRASAMTGQTIRRRHRSHVMRFRTAGVAALTVMVAGAFPAYTALTSGTAAPGLGGPATGPTEPVVPPDSPVPFPPEDTAGPVAPSESPADGVDVATPEPLPTETSRPSPSDATADPQVSMPQDLGDLGDGREFGGIRVNHLPDHLEWGKWSGKNGFGTTSYTTTWNEPGAEPGTYAVQIVVFEGEAAQRMKPRLQSYRADKAAKRVSVRGADGAMANLGEASEVTKTDGTPTILWFLKRDLAVEVMLSPVLAEKLGTQGTAAELKKIANGIRATG
jgi:hypothetical protein